jgi:hypothetical protein
MAMKTKNLSFVAGAVLAASAMMAGSTARAEDLPQTKAHQRFSATQGFSEPALAVLQRASAVDQNQVSADLIKQLRPAIAFKSAKRGSKLHITGEQWSLEVAMGGRISGSGCSSAGALPEQAVVGKDVGDRTGTEGSRLHRFQTCLPDRSRGR